MGKHIEPQEHPLTAPPHSGSSKGKPAAPPKGRPVEGPGAAAKATVRTGQAAGRSPEITEEQIAARAYAIWLDRGCPEGSDHENWAAAERQLREQLSAPHEATAPLMAATTKKPT